MTERHGCRPIGREHTGHGSADFSSYSERSVCWSVSQRTGGEDEESEEEAVGASAMMTIVDRDQLIGKKKRELRKTVEGDRDDQQSVNTDSERISSI